MAGIIRYRDLPIRGHLRQRPPLNSRFQRTIHNITIIKSIKCAPHKRPSLFNIRPHVLFLKGGLIKSRPPYLFFLKMFKKNVNSPPSSVWQNSFFSPFGWGSFFCFVKTKNSVRVNLLFMRSGLPSPRIATPFSSWYNRQSDPAPDPQSEGSPINTLLLMCVRTCQPTYIFH